MRTLTKEALKDLLTASLSLKDPEYRLRRAGDKWAGNVISKTFKGKKDHQRQEMIWDALETKLGKESFRHVGFLLCYTPEEWSYGEDEDALPKSKPKRIAS